MNANSAYRYWLDAGRALKRAIVSRGKFKYGNATMRVTYESRRNKIDRDYAILRKLSSDSSIVFDVGGQNGITAMLMANAMSNSGKVHVFEASERMCEIISENIRLNNLCGHIDIINAVIGAKSGNLVLFAGSSIIDGFVGYSGIPVSKSCLALDDYVEALRINPQLIKIDVEGAERDVLAGMRNILEKIRPIILLELHQWRNTTLSDNAGSIMLLLDDVRYRMVHLGYKQVVTDPDVFRGRGRSHVLLLADEREIPQWLMEFDTEGL